MVKVFYNLLNRTAGQKNFDIVISQIQFLQTTLVYLCGFLLLGTLISSLIHVYRKQTTMFKLLGSFFKSVNIVVLSLSVLTVFIKFSIYLKNFKKFSILVSTKQQIYLELTLQGYSIDFFFNSSTLSDVVLLLAFFSGLVSIVLLGEKNITKFLPNISVFSLFFVSTCLMVYTTNLLVMFISFELLFLPTLYFVYFHGYVERTDKTLKILFYWTLSGAFLVLSTICYLYFKYKTLNYFTLSVINFSVTEKSIIFMTIFLGFGVKIPVYPFHYWLTKIHVEAPAGFSIFLSGFLVKAALFCFFQFNSIFTSKWTVLFVATLSFFGLLEAAVKMWTITDLKKLIAYATIEEMNLILFLLIASQNKLEYSVILFIIVHGLLSTLMFLLVDIIQKKTQTRNVVELGGVLVRFPKVKYLIWFICLLFSGFPLTVKFSIEWQIIGILAMYSPVCQVIITFTLMVVGSVGYIKNMIILMYGLTDNNYQLSPILSKQNKYLIYLIVMTVILLNILNLFLF